jgi:hypothetical protein
MARSETGQERIKEVMEKLLTTKESYSCIFVRDIDLYKELKNTTFVNGDGEIYIKTFHVPGLPCEVFNGKPLEL